MARLFNLAKTTVSALHKELENKVEKLKYKKLEVIQPGTKNKSELPVGLRRLNSGLKNAFNLSVLLL